MSVWKERKGEKGKWLCRRPKTVSLNKIIREGLVIHIWTNIKFLVIISFPADPRARLVSFLSITHTSQIVIPSIHPNAIF